MRPWTGNPSDALYANTMSAKPLSKLDNAKLKLSRLKLKYGKQLHVDPPSSSTSLSSLETSLKSNILKELSKEPSENLVLVEGHSEVMKRDTSESYESDSLKSVSSKELDSEHLPKLSAPVDFFDAKLIHSEKESTSSPSVSSVSEIHENIHSFSSLELKSQIQHDDVSLEVVVEDLVVNNVASTVLESDGTETSVSSSPGTLLSESSIAQTELSQIAPAAAIQNTPTPDALQSESTIAQTELSQMAPAAVIQVTSDRTSSGATNAITLQSSGKSPERVSSVKLVSVKKKPRVRSVKVQTDRKRSRTVQVSLSEQSYEGRIRPSYPILRATSLPRGLCLQEEAVECLANDIEDAFQLVLSSQMKLTLSLLRREQALYFNCSRSAARLEKEYKRHTLSDTRQFIREGRKYRDELRGNS